MSLMVGLPDSALVDETVAFTLLSLHHGSTCSYIIWGMNNRPVGGRSSEKLSHFIDIIIIVTVTRSMAESLSR
jgi:hypothetical protein